MEVKDRIRWVKPTKGKRPVESVQLDTISPHSVSLQEPVIEEVPNLGTLNRQRDLLLDPEFGVGVPVLEGASTAKELAMGLLKLAAEIEHALMVQYLYAADSVDPANDDRRMRRKLQAVAVEEMGHLGSVQNLLLLLGGPDAFHMKRDELRRNSELNPIPFVLEPVTLESLAKYATAEAPAAVPNELKPLADELKEIATSDIGFEPRRVGAVYAMLRWLFMDKEQAVAWMDLEGVLEEATLPQDPHLTDADLQPPEVVESFEVLGVDWGDDDDDFLLLSAKSRAEAIGVINAVAEQGEGFEGSDNSHFDEFLEMAKAYKADPFGLSLTTSPTLVPAHGGENYTEITAPYTRLWAEVQSLQYTLMCIGLLHGFSTPKSDEDTPTMARKQLANLAIKIMRTSLESTSIVLSGLPISESSEQLCGAPYNIDEAVLVTAKSEEYATRQETILLRLEGIYQNIRNSAEFDEFSLDADRLRDIEKKDGERRSVLAQIRSA